LNGLSRWCVPTFIMITGALMLADPRSFAVGYYLRHRVSKVLIPFVAWSLLYAGLAGVTRGGFDVTAYPADRIPVRARLLVEELFT
jgi:surface polysaccharide O-acyltransferase-like enzyme